MVRTKSDASTAVMDPPASPEEIAGRMAAADVAERLALIAADVAEWRRVVLLIADGHDPDPKTVAAMAALCRRLKLQPDGIAEAVQAVQESRRHDAEVSRVRDALVKIKAREPELGREMKAAAARVRELHEEMAGYLGIQAGLPHAVQGAATVRQVNPLLFAKIEHVAERLLKADTGLAASTIKGLISHSSRLDGHVTSMGAWQR